MVTLQDYLFNKWNVIETLYVDYNMFEGIDGQWYITTVYDKTRNIFTGKTIIECLHHFESMGIEFKNCYIRKVLPLNRYDTLKISEVNWHSKDLTPEDFMSY